MKSRWVTQLAGTVLALAATTVAAGCSSSASTDPAAKPAATPAVSLPAGLKQQYLTDENTVLAALGTGGGKLKALPSPVDGDQLVPVLGPMIAATTAFNAQLTQLDWPAALEPKVAALHTADQAWITEATKLEQATGQTTVKQVAGSLGVDLDQQVAAADELRGQLGLAPL